MARRPRPVPPNIADVIQRRLVQEFETQWAYEKGGTYTKPDPDPGEYQKGSYTRHDYTKETSEMEDLASPERPDLQASTPALRDLVRSPEFQERLRRVIDIELQKFDES